MKAWIRLTAVVQLLSLLVLGNAMAASRGPSFKIPSPGVIVFPTAKPGVPYSFDLTSLLQVAGVPPLTWSFTGLPGWLTLDNANSKISGNPTAADAGSANFQISVRDKDNEGGELNRTVQMQVFAPPIFVTSKIDLGIQNENAPWTFELKPLVSDSTTSALTFDATGLPVWITLNKTTGTLSGTPHRADVGKYTGITFLVHSAGGDGTASGFGEVRMVITPPKWITKEITIDNASEDSAYSRNVAEFVVNTDPMVSVLNYEIVSATPPPWLQVGLNSANLFGTPHAANVGNVSVTMRLWAVVNGVTYEDSTVFKFQVVHVNHPPQWLAKPLNLPSAATKVAYAQNVSQSAKDPDVGDKLTFAILSFNGPGTAWATMDPKTGAFTGTPNKDNVGDNSWVVSVTDQGGLSDQTTIQIKVIKSNEPPYWLANPTVLANAKEDQSYSVDLNNYAKDPDNDKLTYTLLDSVSWVTINPNGILSGTPGSKDVGVTKFNVRVSDNITGSAVAEIQIFVEHTNHAPFWTQNPIVISVKEELPMNESIALYAQDPDQGDKLTFSLIEGLPWATLSPTGIFTGTPTVAQEGDNKYRVRVSDSGGLTADVTVIIKVIHVNHPPYWTANPIVLPNAKEGTSYSSSLYDFAKDPDLNDTKRFVKLAGGPAWVMVSSDGVVSGIPARSDVGVNEFQVRVLDAANADAVTTVRITVEKVNHPPRWRQNPILLGQAFEDSTFTFDLSQLAVDDDGDKLTFRLIKGPAWMFVGTDGIIKGTPMKTDIGPFTATFAVSDGQAEAQAEGNGVVIHKNHPPVINAAMPVFEVKERSVRAEDLNKWVTDIDGDKLGYVLEDNSDFVKLSADGTLTLSPKFKDIGLVTLRFKVNDAETAVHGQIQIKVIRDPRAPVWLTDPILLDGKTNESLVASVTGEVRDLDGLRVTFKKKSGPDWLTVDSDGNLKGTPREANLGGNTFEIDACNDVLCATGHVIITVKPGTQIDVVQVDTADPNAKAEYTWIIDNSSWCDKTIKALKKYINVFYSTLSVIKHQGVYLSADAYKHDGTPIRQNNGPILISSNNNPTSDFLKRLDSGVSEDRCGNCNNSPIWSLFRFTQKVTGFSEIYHNGFIMEGVPTDAMIVSHQTDHFPTFTKNKPEMKHWTADDFASAYKKFYASESQAFRMNAMAPKCPKLVDNGTHGSPPSAPDNAYRVVVDATGGKYYATSCEFNMEQALTDYANRIIFRAYVHSKNHIKLSKTPIQVTNSMRVTLGDVQLPGNTGSATDVWYYNESANEVMIRWWLLDQGQVKPGDKLKIEYRVS